jgi:hypothetical protein
VIETRAFLLLFVLKYLFHNFQRVVPPTILLISSTFLGNHALKVCNHALLGFKSLRSVSYEKLAHKLALKPHIVAKKSCPKIHKQQISMLKQTNLIAITSN